MQICLASKIPTVCSRHSIAVNRRYRRSLESTRGGILFGEDIIMAKGKRRGRGEGTVYQRKDGRWVAEITLEDGRRKPLYGKTQAEAIGKRDKALLELKQGILATGPKQRLDSYLERWLEEVCKPTVRLST